MQPGHAVYSDIVEHFGGGILRPDGKIDRRKLSSIAFEGGRIEELNRIVHPAVIAVQERWVQRLFAGDPKAVAIIESALIFEAERSATVPNWTKRFDRLILVAAPDDVKIARYVQRISPGSWDEAAASDARARLAKQIPDSEKIPRCHYVIQNVGTLAQMEEQVRAIYVELCGLSLRRTTGA